jgi:hypothetical protein
MDDFPSNSHQHKLPGAEPEPKKIDRIIEGEVIRRKKPLGTRIKETFVGSDMRSVGQYITFEVLLPAMKDTIADITSQGVERMLFGEARSTSRRTGMRPGGGGYVQYNRMAGERDRRRDREFPSRKARANHDFDDIVLATRVEADEVIDRLFDLVSRYNSATVADLYELLGISGSFTDDKWGWTNLYGAKARRVTGGYLLDLPRPEPLDR